MIVSRTGIIPGNSAEIPPGCLRYSSMYYIKNLAWARNDWGVIFTSMASSINDWPFPCSSIIGRRWRVFWHSLNVTFCQLSCDPSNIRNFRGCREKLWSSIEFVWSELGYFQRTLLFWAARSFAYQNLLLLGHLNYFVTMSTDRCTKGLKTRLKSLLTPFDLVNAS